jgi:hypothetical protein
MELDEAVAILRQYEDIASKAEEAAKVLKAAYLPYLADATDSYGNDIYYPERGSFEEVYDGKVRYESPECTRGCCGYQSWTIPLGNFEDWEAFKAGSIKANEERIAREEAERLADEAQRVIDQENRERAMLEKLKEKYEGS